MSGSPFYCNASSVHFEKTTDKNLVEKGTKLYKKTHLSLVIATETLRYLYKYKSGTVFLVHHLQVKLCRPVIPPNHNT